MDTLVSQLKDLLDLKDKAKLALPGVMCGFFLMILFLPPPPVDLIPVVQSQSTLPPITLPDDLKRGSWFPRRSSDGASRPYGKFLGRAFVPMRPEPACTIDAYRLNHASQLTGMLFEANNVIAQSRQEALEEQNENLDRCLAAERRLAGQEESAIAALNADLSGLETSEGAQARRISDYETLHSPLLNSARELGRISESAVEAKRVKIRRNEQRRRDRQWEIGELTRWKGVVSERLSDPGKLRPELGFDDYLSALSKHVIAFIMLSTIIGILLEGIATPGAVEAMESFLFGAE